MMMIKMSREIERERDDKYMGIHPPSKQLSRNEAVSGVAVISDVVERRDIG